MLNLDARDMLNHKFLFILETFHLLAFLLIFHVALICEPTIKRKNETENNVNICSANEMRLISGTYNVVDIWGSKGLEFKFLNL